jgi:hypothetical protein
VRISDHSYTGSTANIDSARANLAGSFVNAFVNAGFGNDKLMVDASEGDSWIYKNKDHGMLIVLPSCERKSEFGLRYAQCCSIIGLEFAVGHGCWFESCGPLYI